MRAGIAFLLVLTLLPAGAQAQDGASGATWTREDLVVTSWDGTELAASVWIPKDPTPVPAILITNGWNNRHDRASELRWAERYADQGYVVLGWTSRGWGNSGGTITLDGPAEQNDTRTMVDLLAARAKDWHVKMQQSCPTTAIEILCLDGAPDDPVVGMLGESYGGGIQFLTAQGDPRIDSIVPRITWSNLLDSLAPNDVLKAGWITELYGTGMTVSRGAPVPNQQPGDEPDAAGPDQKLTEWYAQSTAANEPTDEMRHEIGWVRSLHPGKLNAPTLLIQGWGDTLFPPNDALATYDELHRRNVTARLILFPGGHGQSLPADDARSLFVDRQMDDWFNVTLRGRAPSLPPYPVIRYRDLEQDHVGELQWPPAGTTTWRGYLDGQLGLGAAPAEASVDLLNPVIPTNCVDVPSFQSQAGENCPFSMEHTSAIWAGPPLEADTEVTGTPVARLVIGSTQLSDVRVFLTLEDVAPDGKTTAVWRQTVPMRLSQSTGQAVNITMQATTHTFPKGHRIGLQVATTDLSFHASREPGTITIMSSPTQPSWLDVPVVPKDQWGDRTAPTFGSVRIGPVVNNETTVEVEVRDDLALRRVSALWTIGGAQESLEVPVLFCPSYEGSAPGMTRGPGGPCVSETSVACVPCGRRSQWVSVTVNVPPASDGLLEYLHLTAEDHVGATATEAIPVLGPRPEEVCGGLGSLQPDGTCRCGNHAKPDGKGSCKIFDDCFEDCQGRRTPGPGLLAVIAGMVALVLARRGSLALDARSTVRRFGRSRIR